MNLQPLIERCPLALSFDLRPLYAYLNRASELFESWLAAPALARLATGEYLARQEFGPVLHQHREEWLRGMLDAFPASEFRAASLLFNLHSDCLMEQLPANSVAKLMLRWAANELYRPLHGESDDDRCGFSADELCAYALNPLVLAMVGGRPAEWVHHIILEKDFDARVWQQVGQDEGKRLLLPLCRQMATMRVCIDRYGQFAPRETPDTARHPLCPEQLPENWHRLFRGFLVLALQHEWLCVPEAEAIMARNPKLEPCWLLAFSGDEASGFPGHLPEFAENLRQRFPALLDRRVHELDLIQSDFESWQGKALSSWFDLRGCGVLMAAARYAQQRPGELTANWPLRRFARVTALDSGETPEAVIQQLEQFSVETLLEVLPWAAKAQGWVLEAMKLAALQPLLQWILDCAKPDSHGGNFEPGPHLVNDADPSKDIFDVPGFHAALVGTKPAEVKLLISAFVKASMMDGLDKIYAALTGTANRDKLWESAVQKENQPAMKLLGLLPVDGADVVRSRYMALQNLYRQAAQYGPQRQATQRAAAQCGLANLAQTAGYLDSAELEWEMELGESTVLAEALKPKQVGEYTVKLVITRFSAAVETQNQAGKTLKNIPSAIKKEPVIVALNSIAVETRNRIRRFMRLMEVRMVRETGVPVEGLRTALAHPAAAAIVTSLVWRDESGRCGLLDKAGFIGPQGSAHIVGDFLWVAHPNRMLEQHGVSDLAMWQQWLVSKRIIQPFKQLFRELYHPNVAELDLVDTSLRYAGRRVKSGIAQGLLHSRGWVPPGAQMDGTYRCSYGDRLWVKCALGFGHFLTEQSETTVGELWFERDGQKLKLADVTLPVFSEAMRDIDLLTAVALAGSDEEGTQLSSSTVAARRVLLSAVAPTLRPGALELGERHVLVHGSRADYRIDLASCRIHFEPGGHLCLIPEGALVRQEVLLPYAEEDLRTADLLRKATLLTHDGKIKDPDFLRQIAVNGRT